MEQLNILGNGSIDNAKLHYCTRRDCFFHIILTFLFFCGTGLFSSCSRDELEKELDPFAFIITPKDIRAFSATLVITHNGSNRDGYYGFVINGHGIDAESCIRDFMTNSPPTASEIMHQRKKQVNINDLSQLTDYTFVVFLLSWEDDKYVYDGCHTVFEFTTKQSEFTASKNPNWSVSYKGEAFYNNGYYSKINVHVSNNESEHYFLKASKPDESSAFQQMEDFLAHATTVFQLEHENDEDDFWLENHLLSNQSSNFFYVLDTGDYVAYVIGVNSDGSPTGHYSQTDTFHVDEYTMTASYENMLGTWTVTDNTGKSFDINFTKHISNRVLIVTGWGGYNYSFLVKFRQSDNRLTFYRQNIIENVSFTFGGVPKTGSLDLEGWWNSGGYHITENIVTIGTGVRLNGNKYYITSAFHVGSGDNNYPMGITYFFHNSDDRILISPTVLTFPITLQKK